MKNARLYSTGLTANLKIAPVKAFAVVDDFQHWKTIIRYAVLFAISDILMQISPRLLNAWSYLQSLKNKFTLKKVLRGTTQIQGLQNNRWEDRLSCTGQNVLKDLQINICEVILCSSPLDCVLNIP